MTKRIGTWQVIIAVVVTIGVIVAIIIGKFIFEARYITHNTTRGWEKEYIEDDDYYQPTIRGKD